MIALGGTIGVGLFMGQQVQLNGLAHQLFCVFNRRDILIFNNESNGRNDLFKSTTGSFATFASEYIHPAAGYMTAWSNIFNGLSLG